MRILIVSDTHRIHTNLEKVIDQVKPIDLFIHLGDTEGAEDYISALAECPSEIIAGNNDFFSASPREKEIMIGNYHVLLTHGHYYGVTLSRSYIMKEARERGMDIVMYGHTHRPVVEYDGGVTLINPGSISYPRQEGKRPSYILMEIDRAGEAHYTINHV